MLNLSSLFIYFFSCVNLHGFGGQGVKSPRPGASPNRAAEGCKDGGQWKQNMFSSLQTSVNIKYL